MISVSLHCAEEMSECMHNGDSTPVVREFLATGLSTEAALLQAEEEAVD